MEAVVALATVGLGLVLAWLLLAWTRAARGPACKTLVFLGSGGHTTEMMRLLSGVDRSKFSPRIYVVSWTDKMSESRCLESERGNSDILCERVPRSREVRQSFLSSILSSLHTFAYALPLLIRHRPDLVSSAEAAVLLHCRLILNCSYCATDLARA
eukprot:m.17731 g.17731  ORF g.17731 m.17731 type:complete len:156 (-) comp3270_c0_seq2:312-779(-)